MGLRFAARTHDVEIRDNRIEDSGGEKQKVGIVIEREARGTVIEGNTFINMHRISYRRARQSEYAA